VETEQGEVGSNATPSKKKVEKKEEKIIEPGRSVNRLGPIPWLTVAQILQTPLYLDFWV
jgi:hypothetical protein